SLCVNILRILVGLLGTVFHALGVSACCICIRCYAEHLHNLPAAECFGSQCLLYWLRKLFLGNSFALLFVILRCSLSGGLRLRCSCYLCLSLRLLLVVYLIFSF